MTTDYIPDQWVEIILRALYTGNRLVCEVMLATGLRIEDVLTLTRTQILMGRPTITEKKTGKKRRIYIPKRLQEEIIYYYEQWGAPPPEATEWAFPSVDMRKHRTRQAVFYDLKRVADEFGIKFNLAPHSFRKTFAVRKFRETGDIIHVQELLNHDNIAVTAIYALADCVRIRERRAAAKKQKRKKG